MAKKKSCHSQKPSKWTHQITNGQKCLKLCEIKVEDLSFNIYRAHNYHKKSKYVTAHALADF